MARHWLTNYLTEHYSLNKQLGLDLGCGLRLYDKFFKCKHIGIDIPSEKFLNSKSPDIFSSGIALPFNNDSFDLITCYSVVPYVEKIDDFFNEIFRVTKSKGIIVIIIMNLRGLALDPNGYYPNRYDSKKLHEKLTQHNFKSVKSKNIKALFYSTYYDLTSVYSYAIVTPKK